MVLPLRERVVRRLGGALAAVAKHAKEESFGADKVTLGQFVADWRTQRRTISEQIRDGTYRFQPLRGVAIAKDDRIPRSLANVRPISILAIRDRVVQRAILDVVWPHVREQVHSNCSFGGIREYKMRSGKTRREHQTRPKSVRAAIERILELRASGLHFAFETDILSFFMSVQKERLLAQLKVLLPDDSLDNILPQTVSTQLGNLEVLGDYAKLWNEQVGIPQGGVLSPLFANLYLFPFDDEIRRAGYSMVRYVDDLVIMTRSRADAETACSLATASLRKLSLEIHPLGCSDSKGRIKTAILDPGAPVHFLGVTLFKNSIQPQEKKFTSLRERIDEITTVDPKEHSTLLDVVSDVNRVVEGWIAAFSFTNLSTTQVDEIDRHSRDRVGGWMKLNELTRDRNVVTERVARLLGLKSPRSLRVVPLLS